MNEFIFVYTTLPKRRKARQLAKDLLRERLVACANIFKIDSLYRWQGELEEAREYGVLLKTRIELYARVEKRIRELHPYELPAVVSFRIDNGSKAFLDWIASETSEHNGRKELE